MESPLWHKLRNPHCTECPLWEGAQSVCLIGAGKLKAEVMLIGEAPGYREDEIRKPFAGKAGRLLDRILEEFRINRRDTYISNAVHCRPPDNRTPKWKEVLACRHYLIDEVRGVEPKIIIAMGNVACMGLTNVRKFTIGENRGNILRIPEDKLSHIPIIPTYHPAAALRKDYYLELILQDFEKALRILKEGTNSGQSKETHYYRGIAVNITDHIVIDLETTGLDPFAIGGNILCFGSTNTSHKGWVTTNGEALRETLGDSRITKIGHNLKFDIKWLITQGYKVKGPLYDTLAAFHLLDENYPNKGLKELVSLHTDMGDYSAKMRRTLQLVKYDMSRVPEVIRNRYCAQDVDGTYRLYNIYEPRLKEEGLVPLFQLMMQAYKVIIKAEIHGFNIDQEKRLELRNNYIKKIDKLSHYLEDLSGLEEFNPNSSQQLGDLLFRKLGFAIVKTTPTGRLSTDESVLLTLKEVDNTGVIDKILKLRQLNGDYSKYLTPEKELCKPDGRVHCDYRITGTVTGRWSCKNPNLQQVPRESRIKELFIPSRSEGYIMQIDYSQGELRLLAEYSRDKKLLQIFDEGEYDIHLAVAAQMLGKSPENVTKEERKAAKTVNFGILYGEGPGKLSKQLGISFMKAVRFMEEYKAQYLGVAKWIREMHHRVIEEGEVISLFGRKRRLVILDQDTPQGQEALRQSANSPVQGGLHDLNILSMVAMDKEIRKQGMRSKFVADVHDEAILDVYDMEEAIELKKIAREVFCNPDTSAFGFEFRVPLEIGIGMGKNWKEAYDDEQKV